MKFADKTRGFTIVEMLTVMGIIAILIGLLVPALNQVKDYAKQVQQKSQFHSIDVALELFKTEFGTYPESSDNVDPYTGNMKGDGRAYCGANKLAEALVGLDYLGFHPNSDFRSDGQNYIVNKLNTFPLPLYKVYHLSTNYAPDWETAEENLKARKGPFIDFENANAFRMDEVYGAANLGVFGSSTYSENGVYYPPVLCDVFSKKRSGAGSKKTGMPILYYRARTMYSEQRYNNDPTPTIPGGILDDIYYYPDNENLLSLGTPEDNTIMHPLRDTGGSGSATDLVDFESMIVNKQVTSIKRPYRAGSYILISAGKDGLYGTGDDIFNFDKGSEQ